MLELPVLDETDGQNDGAPHLLVDLIGLSSLISWQHMNLQDEFNFNEESLRDLVEFDLAKLLSAPV